MSINNKIADFAKIKISDSEDDESEEEIEDLSEARSTLKSNKSNKRDPQNKRNSSRLGVNAFLTQLNNPQSILK